MKENEAIHTDILVIGSGMGGLSAAAMLASAGHEVTVLEASHVAGGCSSSYKRKGYVFESGATTLIGFDEHQPLRTLEALTGVIIPREELQPSMTVHLDGKKIVRYKDRERWIAEAAYQFGNPEGQKRFWQEAFRVADVVWKVSGRNRFFPPQTPADWIALAGNNPLDALVLPYAFKSVSALMKKYKVDTPLFRRFIDEQLMITAQAPADDVPFLFGAAGITYTNYSNFYVPGGLINMVNAMEDHIRTMGGTVLVRRKVKTLERNGSGWVAETESGHRYRASVVVSNLPVWNMGALTSGPVKAYFEKEAAAYDTGWGAFTMGIVTTDSYPEAMSLHHQIHLAEPLPFTGSDSVFVSMSARGDTARCAPGERVLNVSCHTETEGWFNLNGTYDAVKQEVEHAVLAALKQNLPGFEASTLKLAFNATPVSWENWVHRYKGRVGGIPQRMSRSLLDWSPAETPFRGLFLCGDTVYPGQGIPGVTLSGINVYYRIEKFLTKHPLERLESTL